MRWLVFAILACLLGAAQVVVLSTVFTVRP